MSKISIFHFCFGFFIIVCGAMLGAFLSNEETKAFLLDPAIRNSWQYTLSKSAHGHSSLFGIIHILFGLTLPYSRCAYKFKIFQTIGMCLGTIAMSFLLIIKSFAAPLLSYDFLSLYIGACLSLWMISLFLHCAFLGRSFIK